MTKQEILLKIQREHLFALGFAIDNNPDGVSQSMKAAGFPNDGTRKGMFDILLGLMKSGSKETVIKIISKVGYVGNAPNYTGGFSDYFIRNSPPDSKPKTPTANGSKFSWDGLLAGLGAGLSTFVAAGGINGAANSLGMGDTDTNPATCPKSEEAPDCCVGDTVCIDKAKTKKMWIIIGIAAGSILLIIGLAYFVNKNKNKPAKTN